MIIITYIFQVKITSHGYFPWVPKMKNQFELKARLSFLENQINSLQNVLNGGKENFNNQNQSYQKNYNAQNYQQEDLKSILMSKI